MDQRAFTKLCKENGFKLKRDAPAQVYYRLWEGALFQVISIYRQPGIRPQVYLGCYSMYWEIFIRAAKGLSLPFGRFSVSEYAAMKRLPAPSSLEEDFAFAENRLIPYLNNLRSQRDLIRAEAEFSAVYPLQANWNTNLCGAFLYEKEDQAALLRISKVLAQNIEAVIWSLWSSGQYDQDQALADSFRRWVQRRETLLEGYRVALSNIPNLREDFLNKQQQMNLRDLRELEAPAKQHK